MMKIKAEDELIKSKLRKRFAKIGLSQKDSAHNFLNELRELSGTYIKQSNIVLVNYILNGVKAKQPLEKSIALDLEAVLMADDLLLKGAFGKVRKSVSKYLKKFLEKPPKPKRAVKVIYEEGKETLTPKEWGNIDDIVFHYLEDEQSEKATDMLMEAYRMGMQTGEMVAQGVNEDDVAGFSYDKMKDWQEEHDLAEKFQKEGMGQDWAYAATWARERASEHLAVYEDGERKGKAYETITNMFRQQISRGLEQGEDYSKLRSRLIFPETWVDMDGHMKTLSKELTPAQLKEYSVAHLNRDWERFAFNEFQSAFINGKLVRWSKFDVAYVKFSQVRGRGDSCPFCVSSRDTICRLFPSEEAFTTSEYYGGGDNVVGDERASTAVWPGKNNVDRAFNSWWIAAPAHVWCNDDLILTL